MDRLQKWLDLFAQLLTVKAATSLTSIITSFITSIRHVNSSCLASLSLHLDFTWTSLALLHDESSKWKDVCL